MKKDEKQEELSLDPEKEETQQVVEVSRSNDEMSANDNMGVQLVRQQALQSQYIEKLEKLLLKDEITAQDMQNVEYCKAELLSQFLGATSFSSSLADTDGRKKAAEILSSHLGNLYAKTAKLKEKLAKKEALSIIQNDVSETKFGASSTKYRTITDNMLSPDLKNISILAGSLTALIFEKTPLKNLVNNPKTRLTAMLPDLMEEFEQKTTSDEKESFLKWANVLSTGLSKLGSVKSMMSALQGKDISKIMGKLMDSKNIA